MGEVMVITSGKGGVGKTTASANIGTGLALAGKRVVIIDADTGLRNLDLVMGLENRVVYTLNDVIDGNCRFNQALIYDKRCKNLCLLPAAQTKDKDSIKPEQMQKLCESSREKFDYVIIDCPAGIEQGFKNATAGANKAILVVTPEVSSVRDGDRIIGLLEANGLSNIKLIINRLRLDMVKRGDMMTIDDVKEILAIDILGVVPDDEVVVISTNKGEPAIMNQNSRAGQAFNNIVRRIMGEELAILDFDQRNLFYKLKKFFRVGA